MGSPERSKGVNSGPLPLLLLPAGAPQKRRAVKVAGDTQVFESGTLGSVPGGRQAAGLVPDLNHDHVELLVFYSSPLRPACKPTPLGPKHMQETSCKLPLLANWGSVTSSMPQEVEACLLTRSYVTAL